MESNKVTILFAEDDASLAFIVKDSLEEEGYKVIHFADGQSAIDCFDKTKYDLCLLDIMMPNKDGFTVAKIIRQQSDLVPILFLSTRAQEEDRIKGYDSGADDYLAKPFSMQELLKKIEVFIKRTKKLHSTNTEEYTIGSIQFNYTNLKIKNDTDTHNITQKEADLLKFLCDHQNKLLKREEVLTNVWGKDDFFLGRSMDVYMTKIRKYLKSDTTLSLETIHGIGFRFVTPMTSIKE
jgi:DNA-binding response OmpR family regulator